MEPDLHQLALDQGKDHYIDPRTGYLVFTERYLAQRGSCCGSGCRHCPYSDSFQRDREQATLDSCAC